MRPASWQILTGFPMAKPIFSKELISQNENLTEADMRRLSTMNMEEIAREIAKDSLNLGEFADKAKSPQDAEFRKRAACGNNTGSREERREQHRV